MKPRNTFRLIIILIFFAGLFFSVRGAMATQEAKYYVLEKQNNFELRQYEPQILAETYVEGDFKEVGNEGFRQLFGYISGKNRKKQSIPMTAPVSQEADYEKIAMTAPVNQVRMENGELPFLCPPPTPWIRYQSPRTPE